MSRPGDVVARYGGEEFVMLLPDTDSEGAAGIATQLCQAVASLRIVHDQSAIANWITISAGYAAMLPQAQQLPTNLIDHADRMLYQAKHNGRNCACGDWPSAGADCQSAIRMS